MRGWQVLPLVENRFFHGKKRLAKIVFAGKKIVFPTEI